MPVLNGSPPRTGLREDYTEISGIVRWLHGLHCRRSCARPRLRRRAANYRLRCRLRERLRQSGLRIPRRLAWRLRSEHHRSRPTLDRVTSAGWNRAAIRARELPADRPCRSHRSHCSRRSSGDRRLEVNRPWARCARRHGLSRRARGSVRIAASCRGRPH